MSVEHGLVIDTIQKGGTKHHLFTYEEVRSKIVGIYGVPETPDQHDEIQELTKTFMDNQPVIELPEEQHRVLHDGGSS